MSAIQPFGDQCPVVCFYEVLQDPAQHQSRIKRNYSADALTLNDYENF